MSSDRRATLIFPFSKLDLCSAGIWFSALAWRDRLWVLGGWSSSGLAGSRDAEIVPTNAYNVTRSTNLKDGEGIPAGSNWNWGDLWYSEDGVEWFSWDLDAVGWKERHAHSAVILDDSVRTLLAPDPQDAAMPDGLLPLSSPLSRACVRAAVCVRRPRAAAVVRGVAARSAR